MSIMLKDKRATRGSRMSDLVGEAAEQDATFWGDQVWAEDSEDDSFEETEAEVKPDEFDSDFDDSEDSGEENSDNEDAVRKMKVKKTSSNKYKEPPQLKKKRPPAVVVKTETVDDDTLNEGEEGGDDDGDADMEESRTKEKKKKKVGGLDRSDVDLIIVGDRNVRESTKTKSEVASTVRDTERKRGSTKVKAVSSKRIVRQFTQKELLEDALNTQVINEKWLRNQKMAEEDKVAADRPLKQSSAHYIRYISKRGSYNTITFSDVDLMPKIFTPGASNAKTTLYGSDS